MADTVRTAVARLENRLEFETLIADTSAFLFATPPDQLDHAVEHALSRVREFFQADRCVLLTVSPDQRTVTIRLASYGEGIPSVPADIDLAAVFPWSRQRLLIERAPVRIARRADLPGAEVRERASWEALPIQSALTLPIETAGAVSHLILLNTLHRESEWPDVFVTRLRVLGEMLVGALERQAMFTGLREAEERLNLAADSAGAGLWILDYGTGVFWATEQARTLFGYSATETIDLARLETSVHPDDRDLVRAAIDRAARERVSIEVEYRIGTPGADGVRWLVSRGRPRFAPDGGPESLTGITIDVTARMAAQEALRRSEARLASGADLAGLAFYDIDYRAGTAYVDERFRALCGLPPGPLAGLQSVQFWLDHLHPDDFPEVLDVRLRLHDGRLERINVEYRYLHPVEGQIWIQHQARVTSRDNAGRAVTTAGVLRGISERKQAEEELHDLSRRLIRAHEEERALLARELHDDLSQRLAVLAIDVGRAENSAADGAQAEVMQAVREGLVRLSEDIHSLAYQLHPSVLEELGLVEALRTECERRGRASRLEVVADLEPLSGTLSKDAALCLLRVAQEALGNVARHSGAPAAVLTLRRMDDGLLLAVRDDGAGFDPKRSASGRHLGLASMRERVRLVGGTLDIESAPGEGTTVVAWVPASEGPA